MKLETSKRKAAIVVITGALVAIAPSFFGYLQATSEIRAKYRASQTKAEASYDTIVDQVKDLQQALVREHDYIVKLEGQVATLTALLMSERMAMAAPTHAARARGYEPPVPLPQVPRSPARPDFRPAPNFGDVGK